MQLLRPLRLPRLRNGNDDCDYIDHRTATTTTSTTSSTTRNDYLLDVDYLHYYNVSFLHVSAISFFPASNPKTSPHVCTLNPNPNTYALFSITCQLFYECHLIMSHCILLGCG